MTTETIVAIGAVISAAILIIGTISKVFKWFERQKKQDMEIQSIKEEDAMICYCLFAVLDGLRQLGANGNVSEAHEKLQKYLNNKSHQ
ncbi:MAG: hypothetical protein IKY41_01390 [Clostridia bacterium]|nr:hypothetical protein [Clostridia bacterium]